MCVLRARGYISLQSARVRSVISMNSIEQQPPLQLQEDVSKISVVAEKAKKRPRASRKAKAVGTTTTTTTTQTDKSPKKRSKKEKKEMAPPTDKSDVIAVAAASSTSAASINTADCAGLLIDNAIIEDGFVKTNTRIKAKRNTMVLLSCPQLKVEDRSLPIYSEDFSAILTVDSSGKNCIIVLHMHSDVVIESNVLIFKVINQ